MFTGDVAGKVHGRIDIDDKQEWLLAASPSNEQILDAAKDRLIGLVKERREDRLGDARASLEQLTAASR